MMWIPPEKNKPSRSRQYLNRTTGFPLETCPVKNPAKNPAKKSGTYGGGIYEEYSGIPRGDVKVTLWRVDSPERYRDFAARDPA